MSTYISYGDDGDERVASSESECLTARALFEMMSRVNNHADQAPLDLDVYVTESDGKQKVLHSVRLCRRDSDKQWVLHLSTKANYRP